MKKSILKFVCTLLVIALLGFTLLHGVDLGFAQIPSITNTEDGIRLGLDLVGGSIITYQADIEGEMAPEELSQNMDVVVDMLRQRLDFQGLFEANVYQVGEDQVTVEIPSVSDPEEAVQTLGSTAQLQFLDDDGNVILEGNEVESATAEYQPIDSTGIRYNIVVLQLTDEGAEKFAEATKKAAQSTDGKNHINITMDGQTISAPQVGSQYAETGITGGEVIISGDFTSESAGQLANNIAIGQLPFSLKQVEMRSVGAQLGMDALTSSIQAGVIGVILVMLFMLFRYRLCGLVADIALTIYIMIVVLLLALTGAQLTLPGVAGIILGIGMAVDANVVIFERIREEVKVGRPIGSAVRKGFSNALSAIIDSNVTTIIAAVVLYAFGTGSVRGFALTLGIGVATSLFTAVFVTHKLLDIFADMGIKNQKLYV